MRFTVAAISTIKSQRGIALVVFMELLVAIIVGQSTATTTKDGDFARRNSSHKQQQQQQQQSQVNDSIVVVGRHIANLNRISVEATPKTTIIKTQQKQESHQASPATLANTKNTTKTTAAATSGLPGRLREGRFISAEDNGEEEAEGADDQVAVAPPSEEQQQTEELPVRTTTAAQNVVPQEGAAQVKRASRNVQRKMELLSGRVNQIQSLIAEDHGLSSQQGGAGANNYTEYPTNQSSEQNGSELTGDSFAPYSSQDSSSTNNNADENRQDAPVVSNGPIGGNSADNSLSSSPQQTNGGEQWSAPLNDGDEQLESQRLSYGRAKQVNDSTATTGPNWTTTPIIKSVIPTRSVPTASSLRSADSSFQQAGEASDNSVVIGNSRKHTGEEQEADGGQRVLSSSEIDSRDMNKTSAGQSSQPTVRYSSGPISSGDSQPQASMLGPEWSPNQNYQYFSELNAKNHGQGASGAVGVETAPQAAAASRQQFVGADGRSRFQNMTIVNSDTDLVNSFSNQQQQQLHQEQQLSPPPTSTSTTSTTTTTTRRPNGGGDSKGRKKSIYTYTGSNYGKSTKSKGRSSSNHLLNESAPTALSSRDSNQGGHHPPDRDYEQSSARNDTGSSSFAHSNNNYLASAPIQWPAFAYSSAQQQQSNQVQPQQQSAPASMVNENIVGLPSNGNSFHNNRYSAIMQPAGQQQQQQLSAQESSQSQEIVRPKMYTADTAMNYYANSYGDPMNLMATNQNSSDLKHRSSNTNSMDDSSGNSLNYATNSQMNSNNNNNDQQQQLQQVFSASSAGDSAYMGDTSSQDYGAGSQGSYGDQAVSSFSGNGRNRYAQGQQQQQDSRNVYSMSSADQFASSPDGDSGYASGYGQQPAGGYDGTSESATLAAEQASGRSGINTYIQEANRNELTSSQNNYQTYAGQEALQQAATNQQYINNNLRQQQLSQMAAAIVSQNPSLANVDINSLVQRYQQQQQQRLLANQQLQNRQASESNSLFSSPYNSNSISRAYYEQQQQQQQQNVNKRYSPTDSISNYLMNHQRSEPSSAGSQYAQASELMPYSMATSNQFAVQPSYTSPGASYSSSPASLEGRSLRAVNLAYYRAALAAAAAANRQATEAFNTSPYMTLSAPTSSSQLYATSGGGAGGSNNNYSSGSGLLYANAAMNSPTFFEAPSQMLRQQQQQQARAAAASSGESSSTSAASGGASNSDSQSAAAANQRSQAAQSSRRSYLNSLFKPTASSRYYYAPTILSPISLASSTSLHPIYAQSYGQAAAASSAAEAAAAASAIPTLQALPQLYAANPYVLPATAHHHQSLAAASQVEQAAQQQYQAYAQAAAAAAAAAALQPTGQYMADTEMAESSLVPSDNYGSSSEVSSSSMSSDNNDGGNSNGASSGAGSNGASATKSGKGGVTPWTNIAGLLLGILPFGILMASLLPAVTVAGRKKRQLELSGRNFSELLKWRAPSRVLGALIAQQQKLHSAGAIGSLSGLANGTLAALINEQLIGNNSSNNNSHNNDNNNTSSNNRQRSSFVVGKSSDNSSSSKSISIGDARYSPLAEASNDKQLAQSQVHDRSGASFSSSSNSNELQQQHPALASGFQLLAPTTTTTQTSNSNSTSTTLSSPVPTTTPMSTSLPSRFVAPASAGDSTGVKSKVRKAMSTLNDFIVAAQNIKRRHRSSNVIESQWNLPSMLRNSLKLDNLFNMNEYKRQLANLANRKVLAMAQNQLLHFQQQQQRNKQQTAQSQTQVNLLKVQASNADENKSNDEDVGTGNGATNKIKKAGSSIVLAGRDVKATDSAQSVKLNQTTAQQAAIDRGAEPTQTVASISVVVDNSSSANRSDNRYNLSFRPKQHQVAGHPSAGATAATTTTTASTTTPRDLFVDQQKAPESWTSVTTQRPPMPTKLVSAGIQTRTDSLMQHADSISGERARTKVEKHSFVDLSSTTQEASKIDPATQNQLDICLRQFLCRLAEKLNKSLKRSLVSQVEANRAKNSTLSPDNLEKLTKRYINQLIGQIETEHPSVKLSSSLASTTSKDGPTKREVRGTQQQQQQQMDDKSKKHTNNMEAIDEKGTKKEGLADDLYRSAMRNDCSSKYNCVELLQLERTLAKMKLKFS